MISERLKTEREFLGLSQQALAERVGVSLRSQQNYEAGNRAPDSEYLAAMAAAGADVLYILTGQRAGTGTAPTGPALDESLLAEAIKVVEQLLSKTGRSLTPAKKAKHVMALYHALLSGQEGDAEAISQALARAA